MKQHLFLPLFTVLASAAIASIAAVGPPPTITKEPISLTVLPGRAATFSAKATNALTYQWTFSGRQLADGGSIAGSHSNVLTIDPVATADAGSYQLTAYNSFGSATSSIVKLTVPLEAAKPVVIIVKPAIGTRSNNITFSGTVSDSVRVAGVSYVIKNLNNPNYILSGQAALSSGKGSSNWTFVPGFLSPGTNILMVQGSNYSARTTTVTRAFFFRDTAPLALSAEGTATGTITGHASFAGDPAPSNGVNLYVGEGYTLTATPARNALFAFWLVNNTMVTSNKTFSFIMENGLNVQAVFLTNNFIGMAGRYDGIFSGGAETNSGLIGNLRLGTNGAYSGTLYLAGSTYPLHGAFNFPQDQATETVPRPNASGSNVTLNLFLLPESTPRAIVGFAQSAGWQTDNIMLIAALTNTQSVSYTMLFQPVSIGTPSGYGYALITNRNGVLNLGGALADGSAFTESTALGEDNEFPIYANLYNRGGSFLGRVSATNPSPVLAQWIKPQAKSGAYSNGFNTQIRVLASVWSQAQGTYSNIVAKDPNLDISGPGLPSDIMATFKTGATTVTGEGTNLSTFGFNPANGMLSVVFTNDLRKVVRGYGALLQDASLGAGYYLGTTNDGRFTLSGGPP